MDSDTDDICNGLSSVVTRDGQGPATAVLRVNGVGATPYGAIADTASANIILNKHGSTHVSNIYGTNDGVLRWTLNIGGIQPETGANAGSNLLINRYSDAGAFIDAPFSIARNTGIVTIANLNVLGGITAPISATNISASGTLSVGSTSTFTGAATFNASPLTISRPSGQQALINYIATRFWQVGQQTNGTFLFFDATAGLSRLIIDAAGLVTIGGGASITGAIVGGTNIQCDVAAGQNALYYGLVAGVRQWYWGVLSTGSWVVTDNTGGVNRVTIDTAGHMTVNGALTSNSNFNANQINGTVGIFTTNVQVNPASGAAWYYAYCAGVRQWQWGTQTNGEWWLYDSSAANLALSVSTGGNLVLSGNATITGTLSVTGASTLHAITCGAINTGGSTITAGSLTITPGAIACNAITCSTINTQGNNITMGAGDITCRNISASGTLGVTLLATMGNINCANINTGGNTITAGPVNCGAITCSTVNASGVVTVVNGINYSNLGAHTIGFDNSGGTLTFFALGGTTASWGFTVSDERFKENIAAPEGDALAEIRSLGLISFDLPDPELPTRHFNRGFSAQEVERRIPESVTRITLPDGREQLVLETLSILARCVGAIQQLADRIETLERRA